MKNLLYNLLCCTLLLTGCTKDLPNENPVEIPEPDYNSFYSPRHFYGIAIPHNETKGTVQMDNLWYVGTTIKIKFLNDPYNQAANIERWACEWEQYANIRFKFVDATEEAHVRIGFDWNDNRWITWSYIGTDCKIVTDQNEATMSFAFWEWATEQEKRGDVLRAFGQVLGMELEHRHLDFDPGWISEAQVRKYWGLDIEDIPWEQLQKYVYTALERANTLQTDAYDPQSIMIWPFAKQYAINTEKSYNYELSEKDKEFIATVYPKTDLLLISMTTSKESVELKMGTGNHTVDITVDWGDGTQEIMTFHPGVTDIFSHTYSTPGTRIIEVYGVRNAINVFSVGNNQLQSLMFHEVLPDLGSLDCEQNSIRELSLKNLPSLWWFICDNNPSLRQLDVSYVPQLYYLSCMGTALSRLDLSPLKKLTILNLANTQLQELDLTDNLQINYLTIRNAPICINRDALVQMAQTLPVVTNTSEGILNLQNDASAVWIEEICVEKNWNIE